MAPHNLPKLLPFIFFASLLVGCAQPNRSATLTLTVVPTNTQAASSNLKIQDVVLLSLEENGYAHLFFYVPGELPLTRITYGDWDDTDPALSPDGTKVAFASNREGGWDLYILELISGEITRVTNSPEYDSAPSWSPDNQWLAFETYLNENLEVAVVSLTDNDQEIILLTEDASSDHSPS